MRLLLFVSLLLLLGLLSGTPTAQTVTDQITEAVLAAPESLRAGTNSLICEPDGPQPGFGVECYHRSFQAVMDWTYRRLAEGARTYREAYADGGPDADINAGAMQYALIGQTKEDAVQTMSIKLPYATADSTGLPIEERNNGPWLMWGGTAAAHIMFSTKPPGVPDEYPGR